MVRKSSSSNNKSSNDNRSVPSQSINGFFVIPVSLAASSSSHYVYARKHEPAVIDPTSPPQHVVFLANIPIDSTTAHVRSFFNTLAPSASVASVTFLPAPTANASSGLDIPSTTSLAPSESSSSSLSSFGIVPIRRIYPSGSAAHVHFSDKQGLHDALAGLKKSPGLPEWREDGTTEVAGNATGTSRYMAVHARKYVADRVVQSAVDRFMASFNKLEARKVRDAKRAFSEPDAEGFVTVSKVISGRAGAQAAGSGDSDAIRQDARKRQKKAELKDFYRFQIRQEKKERMNDLLKNFKQDQERIKELKAKKKFRPFSGNSLA
ncbi:ribosomal RNA-processing protein 7-domain-containing protein [Lipomyces japonicus]|uniref:ribosomal RNA-processing protein 7-domain-containing protein n=1 Tax=Lipomyces japonicus TaxID=56871 RepID=UPI0034CEF38A